MAKERVVETGSDVRKYWNRLPFLAKAGSIALSASATATASLAIAFETSNKSGEYEVFEPSPRELAATPTAVDNRLSIVSWNVHGSAANREIEGLVREYSPDVIALQEVPSEESSVLENNTTGLYVTSATADAKAKLMSGLSNVVLTRQAPRDIETTSISGTPFLPIIPGWIKGMSVDLVKVAASIDDLFVEEARAETFLKNTKEARQEDRSALALTVSVKEGDQMKDIRFITSHLSGVNEVEEQQRHELKDFIVRNLEKGRTTVFCGDLNAPLEVIIPWFRSMGFTVLRTEPTHTNGHQVLDVCAEWDGDDSSKVISKGKVDKKFKSDHYAVTVEAELPKSEQISLRYPHPTSSEREKRNYLELHFRSYEKSKISEKTSGR